jgi:hypothetical protein
MGSSNKLLNQATSCQHGPIISMGSYNDHCFLFLFSFELVTSIGIVEPLHCRVTRTIPCCLVSLTLKAWKKDHKEAMLRASHIPPVATPALSALKISLIPALSLSSSLPHLYKLSTFAPLQNFLPKTAPPNSSPISFKRFLPMLGHHPCPKGTSGQFYQKPYVSFFLIWSVKHT